MTVWCQRWRRKRRSLFSRYKH